MNAQCIGRASFSLIGGILLVMLLLVLLPFGAQARSTAATRFVSPAGADAANVCTNSLAPCRTVQRAVEVSADGDEIRVAQGVYTGTMAESRPAGGTFSATVVLTKNLSALLGGYSADFSSHDPAAHETILSASDAPRKFVIFISGTTTLVDGFTLTGATGACPTDCVALQYNGGAVWIRGGAPTLSHNRIQNNRAYYTGGGIYSSQGAAPLIASNIIYSNTADFHEDGGGQGGGIYVGSGSVVITGNVIISNVAEVEGGGIFVNLNVPATIVSNTLAHNRVTSTTVGLGGGINVKAGTSVTIAGNLIESNVSAGSGGGIAIDNSMAIITGNVILSNAADFIGGGIMLGGSQAAVVSNTIAHNRVLTSDSLGGGMIMLWDASGTVRGNRVFDNHAIGAGGGIHIQDCQPTDVSQNEIYSNTTVSGGGGGLSIFACHAEVTVDSNAVYRNASIGGWGDGAILFYDMDYPITLTNNVVVTNTSSGIWLEDFADVRFINNTIAQNSVNGILAYIHATDISPTLVSVVNSIIANQPNCGLAVSDVDGRGAIPVTADYNDVWGNGANYCDLANPPSGAHNLSVDPQFVNAAAGDYRPRFGSPVMNAGTNVEAPARDKDGVARPQMGWVDMGAYEVIGQNVYLPLITRNFKATSIVEQVGDGGLIILK